MGGGEVEHEESVRPAARHLMDPIHGPHLILGDAIPVAQSRAGTPGDRTGVAGHGRLPGRIPRNRQ